MDLCLYFVPRHEGPPPGVFKSVECCPRCDSADIWPEFSGHPYGLYCRSCQWGGPRASAADGDPDEAIAAWNAEARKIAQARDLGLKLNLMQPPVHPDE